MTEQQDSKACPWCGETILAVAKKCKHCGEFLEQRSAAGGDASRDEAAAHELSLACLTVQSERRPNEAPKELAKLLKKGLSRGKRSGVPSRDELRLYVAGIQLIGATNRSAVALTLNVPEDQAYEALLRAVFAELWPQHVSRAGEVANVVDRVVDQMSQGQEFTAANEFAAALVDEWSGDPEATVALVAFLIGKLTAAAFMGGRYAEQLSRKPPGIWRT